MFFLVIKIVPSLFNNMQALREELHVAEPLFDSIISNCFVHPASNSGYSLELFIIKCRIRSKVILHDALVGSLPVVSDLLFLPRMLVFTDGIIFVRSLPLA